MKYLNSININYKENVSKKNSKNLNDKVKIILIFVIFIIYSIVNIIFLLKKKHISNFKKELNRKNINLLKVMTNYNKALYEGAEKCLENNPDKQLCLYQFLCPKEVIDRKRVLMGEKKDGCYVMLDDFENIKIAYSIGISVSNQFDKALADKGIDIYMYDHTISRLPSENEKFHWKKIGIGGNSERSSNIQTLQDMIKENGHINQKNMIFKMDVEGAEWNSLNDISEKILCQFKYLLFEFHFGKKDLILFYNILKKIYKTHQAFYVHCSPFSRIISFGNNRLCSALEVSYIIRNGYKFSKDKSFYPIKEFSYGYKEGF